MFKKNHFSLFIIILLFICLCSICKGSLDAAEIKISDDNEIVDLLKRGGLKLKVTHYMIILDNSISMSESYYKGKLKEDVAREFISRFHDYLPDVEALNEDVNQTTYKLYGAFRIFGSVKQPQSIFDDDTRLLTNDFELYSKNTMNSIFNKKRLSPYGESLLEKALRSAITDFVLIKEPPPHLVQVSDPSMRPYVIIIISDWKEMSEKPRRMFQSMKVDPILNDKLCIYPVFIGDDRMAYDHMVSYFNGLHSLLSTRRKKFISVDEDLASNEGLKDFVKDVFFTEKKGSPITSPEPYKICGPDTSFNLCINFDFDQDIIKPEFYDHLNTVIYYLKQCPHMYECIEIQGHTDSIGTQTYNENLSHKRAMAVYNYFMKNGLIEYQHKFFTKGYGFSEPIDSNISEVGRSLNRRTILKKVDQIHCRYNTIFDKYNNTIMEQK